MLRSGGKFHWGTIMSIDEIPPALITTFLGSEIVNFISIEEVDFLNRRIEDDVMKILEGTDSCCNSRFNAWDRNYTTHGNLHSKTLFTYRANQTINVIFYRVNSTSKQRCACSGKERGETGLYEPSRPKMCQWRHAYLRATAVTFILRLYLSDNQSINIIFYRGFKISKQRCACRGK